MFKFAIFFTLCFVTIKAQVDPFEICKGYPDGTLIGPGEDVSCNLYYYCESEYGFEEFCEEGFEFNYETNECDYDDVVNCAANLPLEPEPEPETIPPTTTVSPVTSPPVSTTTDSSIADIECPTNRPGEILFFPSSNCTEYFICANGVRMRMTCMEGFTWNQDERTCDYPIFSKCSSNIADDGMTVRCTRTGFYSTAYPRDCTKFVFCSQGIPMVQNCPVGYAWHIERCVERRFASCPDTRRLF